MQQIWDIKHKYRNYLVEQGKSQNTILSYINDLSIFFQETGLDQNSYVISNR